jgi:hypothetical protein
MYRLNPIDYEFLKSNYGNNTVVGNIAIIKKCKDKNLKKIISNNIKKNINSSIIYSHKVVELEGSIFYPYLKKAIDLDVEAHVYEYYANEKDSVDEIYSKILSFPLNIDQPLWDIHIVYDINDDGDAAIFRRYHHALADSDAHADVHNIICDNYNAKKIKPTVKVNVFNNIINIIFCFIKYYYYLIYGFLFKSNKYSYKNKIDKKNIIRGKFRIKKHQKNNVIFFSYDISDIKNSLEKLNISTLEFCMFAASNIYGKILQPDQEKTMLTMLPISYRKSKDKDYGNKVTAAYVDLLINEKDDAIKIQKLKEEISFKINLAKNTPYLWYCKALCSDPRLKNKNKIWNLFYKSEWSSRKKIYKKKKDTLHISTTTSFKKIKKTENTIGGQKIDCVYNYSTAMVRSPAAVGCAISFRYDGEKIHTGIVYSWDLYKDSSLFYNGFCEAIETLGKLSSGYKRNI